MFSTFNIAEHVLAVSFDKVVDSSAEKKFRKLLEKKLETSSRINLYFEVRGKKSITFSAFFKDMSLFIKHSHNFEKIAIVSDNKMLQKSMELKSLFLNSEIQAFDIEDRIEAMNWVMNKIQKNTLKN